MLLGYLNPRFGRRPAVAARISGVPQLPGPGEYGDISVARDLVNPVGVVVDNQNVALGVECNVPQAGEGKIRRGTLPEPIGCGWRENE